MAVSPTRTAVLVECGDIDRHEEKPMAKKNAKKTKEPIEHCADSCCPFDDWHRLEKIVDALMRDRDDETLPEDEQDERAQHLTDVLGEVMDAVRTTRIAEEFGVCTSCFGTHVAWRGVQ